ncbi:NmrA family NAD(P)-binding protein [Streptomyces longispororuber]|uniref:NmrA family NAD(P)-binding protein n=1 Tax=Streptomyces longispororuber TaxID=68230 RepID=UPI00210AB9E9|nr:NmrA family NAD(P)-binding protein [Streptomyces longispororuber]MCQ4211690.1 NmrA family NAD(P)-binding protein [Streptomyces longispororuber]
MILVTGATGSIGKSLVGRLSQNGVEFRALVRDEAKGRALGCDFVVGDFDDRDSLTAALEGADRLFLNGPGAEPVNGEQQPMIRRQKSVIDAALKAGVTHVVKVSVWHARQGAKLSQGAHWEIDEYLKASGLDWSLLHPAGFMQNFIAPSAFAPDGSLLSSYGDTPVAHIDCHDIAACGAALLTGATGRGESFVLTGSEALTDAEVAERMSSALGRAVGRVELPADSLAEAIRAQGLPTECAEDLAVLVEEVAAGSQAAPTTTVRAITGRPARTFDDFLSANLQSLRAVAVPSRL